MNNPFKNILSSFAGDTESSILGVDIGTSTIKIVQLKKKKGKAVLETYGEIALGPYATQEVGRVTNLGLDKIAEALNDLLRESNTTTKNCGLSIPISSSLITFIKMPDVDDRQLAQMVPIEARKYIPVAPSEVSINYWTIPKEESPFNDFQAPGQAPEKERDILLVVVHNDAIGKNKDIMNQAHLLSSYSEIEIFGSIRSVLEQSLVPQMIVDFGANTTKLYIVERGILRNSHVINRGSQDITLAISKSSGIPFIDAENLKKEKGLTGLEGERDLHEIASISLDYVFSEAHRVILNYQKKYDKNIGHVFLSGGGSALKGLIEFAEMNLELPCSVADPFSKVEYPAFLENILKTVGPEFSVAIGLALRGLQER